MTHMREAIRNFFRKPRIEMRHQNLVRHNLETGEVTPVIPITELTCSYCGGKEFFEGPSGGMAVNVLCANKHCRHWFNVCPPIGMMDDLHKVEPEDEYPTNEAAEARPS